jgi:small nuclear ribonucleoprotein (snRNP)-like protein
LTKLLSLQIEVRLPNGQCVKGLLQYYNLQLNIAVVNNIVFPGIRAANLYPMEIETASEVVAVGRLFNSGRLPATRAIVTDKKSNLDCDKLMVSTCKITKVHYSIPLIVTLWI